VVIAKNDIKWQVVIAEKDLAFKKIDLALAEQTVIISELRTKLEEDQ
jgi:hypothetical protein